MRSLRLVSSSVVAGVCIVEVVVCAVESDNRLGFAFAVLAILFADRIDRIWEEK